MAKRSGIKVEEFGFGLPPRIWGKKKGETIYSINAIPFGGFVRMLGESSVDKSMLKKKNSFAAQSMRNRVKVIVAGVFMNFLLAWVLLTFGFSVGMQPLLVPDDVFPSVSSGIIELDEGVKIKNVEDGGLFDKTGFKNDDVIFSFNGNQLDSFAAQKMIELPVGKFEVMRDGKILSYEISEKDANEALNAGGFGLETYDFVSFPRVKIYDLDISSDYYIAGLRSGDVILSVNGNQIFSVVDYENYVRGEDVLEYVVYRNGVREDVIVELKPSRKVIISDVIPESVAQKAGFKSGDIILSVSGKMIRDSEELIRMVEEQSGKKLSYLVDRNGAMMNFEIMPDEGKIGVMLSELMKYGGGGNEMSLYNADVVSTVLNIKDVKYPWYEAIYKSFGEGVRLSKLTGEMFVSFVGGFFSGNGVPESVAGPVGIAQMTHSFVEEGVIPVIRFVAILSLSLAVINILPFPALDGGRLLFILIELIIGRRVNEKWESLIHMFGYALILLLIVAVTYNDIVKLVTG
jgi:membrane-associated protease RseP (regulator of RpoE activity)